MLDFLKINNVALIKDLELNLGKGFNVILGETGAGKSIIIDALNFVLGEKADKTLIRDGEEFMKVAAKFTSSNEYVCKKLTELGFNVEDGEILLSRSFSLLGKNDARINGEPISISTLKEIGDMLVDAYSQHESVSLLKQKNHLAILDSYKPLELKDLKEKIEVKITDLNKINKEIKSLGGSEENREREIDILSFQIKEIEDADLKIDEDVDLKETLEKMSYSEKVLSALTTANQAFQGEDTSALDFLRTVIRSLSSVEAYDVKIAEINKELEDISLNLRDIGEQIFQLGESYNFDERSLEQLMFRREKIDALKRKYGGDISKIYEFLHTAKEQLDKLQNAEEMLLSKEKDKKIILDELLNLMNSLWKVRKEQALEIEEKVVKGLSELGILKAQFKINFFSTADSIYDLDTWSINCLQDVEFLFSANYGEDLKPLAKTISGGELNRFMLIFKNIIAEIYGSETLVFDEIDSGVSGKIANAVALKMAKLSKQYQIICITHLAQVASMGDDFFYVLKSQKDNRTETQIKQLNDSEISEQIALLSYGDVTESSLYFAKNMLLQNKQIKINIE